MAHGFARFGLLADFGMCFRVRAVAPCRRFCGAAGTPSRSALSSAASKLGKLGRGKEPLARLLAVRLDFMRRVGVPGP